MESSNPYYFCHTCKKLFKNSPVPSNPDDDVLCAFCQDPFVELIEDDEQMKTLKQLYNITEEPASVRCESDGDQFFDCSEEHPHEERKEEAKNDQSNRHPNGQQDVFNQFNDNIQSILRSQGQTSTVQANGQSINVTTAQSQHGNDQIIIAQIESQDQDWEDVDDEDNPNQRDPSSPIAESPIIENIQMDIVIDEMPLEFDQQQQPEPQQQQQQIPQMPPAFNIANMINNILGIPQGAGAHIAGPGVQIFQHVFNPQQNPPQAGQPQQQPFNLFNLFPGMQGFQIPAFPGAQLEQNILNQVLQQSLDSALNQQHGVPTSRAFIQNMKVIKGSELTQKEECQVCFDAFVESDQLYSLPCKHMFHNSCILPWLDKHNTCPSCRKELPTDDLEHESNRRANPNDEIFQFLTNPNYRPPGAGGAGAGSSSSTNNNGAGSQQPFNSTYHA